MKAIFRGRRYIVVSPATESVWIERLAPNSERIQVALGDPDLIVDPTREDLDLADAFERGEIGAFEYPDGHTYPPGREIGPTRKPRTDPRPGLRSPGAARRH